MPSPSFIEPPDESAAAAEYIATMTKDLSVIARRHGLDTLGYLLEIARLEARRNAQRDSGG